MHAHTRMHTHTHTHTHTYTHAQTVQAGLVEDMNELASRFVSETAARESILSEATTAAESHEDPK